ncbi:MAG: hypothetical protein WD794_12905 [Mycobacteriales bacterium]
MTQPDSTPQVSEGTDITADPDNLETEDRPASTDPEQLTDDGRLGGVAGTGGAG